MGNVFGGAETVQSRRTRDDLLSLLCSGFLREYEFDIPTDIIGICIRFSSEQLIVTATDWDRCYSYCSQYQKTNIVTVYENVVEWTGLYPGIRRVDTAMSYTEGVHEWKLRMDAVSIGNADSKGLDIGIVQSGWNWPSKRQFYAFNPLNGYVFSEDVFGVDNEYSKRKSAQRIQLKKGDVMTVILDLHRNKLEFNYKNSKNLVGMKVYIPKRKPVEYWMSVRHDYGGNRVILLSHKERQLTENGMSEKLQFLARSH